MCYFINTFKNTITKKYAYVNLELFVVNAKYGKTSYCTTLYQRDVSDSAVLTTYHCLHIQHLRRSS